MKTKVFKRLLVLEMLLLTLAVFILVEFSFSITGSGLEYQEGFVRDKFPSETTIKANVAIMDNVVVVEQEILFSEYKTNIWLNIPAGLYADVSLEMLAPQAYRVEKYNDNLAMQMVFLDAVSSIQLKYKVILGKGRDILSLHKDQTLLTQLFITPAVIIDGKPVLTIKSEFGDPFVYPMLDYEVSLEVDSDYSVFAPGLESETTNGERKKYFFSTQQVRDFPMIAYKNPNVKKYKIRDVDIVYINMPEVHHHVLNAFDYIESKTGLYPYKEFFVALAPISLQGMEFSQMIFLSDSLLYNATALRKLIYHEVFHQWFYGLIGTNQVDEPFIDEGLVCYLTNDLLGEGGNHNYNESLYFEGLDKYPTKSKYYAHIYNNGAAYFAKLHRIHGDTFDKLLYNIYQKYNGKILTKKDFEQELLMLDNGDDSI